MPHELALRFVGVSKRFQSVQNGDRTGVPALAKISLDVCRGDSVGVIGPNGAGKSTLLKLAAGILTPSLGEIRVRGSVASVIELGIGLHPELSGLENLDFVASLLGMTTKQLALVRTEVIEFSGLGDHLKRPVKHYSSGMRARLAFALVAWSGAEILLLDEVLAVGDQEFRGRSVDRLRSLNGSGTTILVVSHDLPAIVQICDRAVLLKKGAIAADGAAVDIASSYAGASPTTSGQPNCLAIMPVADVVEVGTPIRLECSVFTEVAISQPELRIELRDGSGLGLDEGRPAFAGARIPLGRVPAGETSFTLEISTEGWMTIALNAELILEGSGARPRMVASAPLRTRGGAHSKWQFTLSAAWSVHEVSSI